MSDTAPTPARLEALLFAVGKPLSRAEAARLLQCSADEVASAAAELRQGAAERGVVLVDDGGELELRIAASASELVERMRRDEYSRDIGRAGLEVLAAILYRGPLTRGEVDFVRGVNSSQTVRTLLMRGLIRKSTAAKPTQGKGGSFVYEPTTELLAALGITHASELPDYATVRERLAALEAAYRESSAAQESTA